MTDRNLQYTDDQIRAIKEEFARRSKTQIVLTIVGILAGASFGFVGKAWVTGSGQPVVLGGLVVFILVVMVLLLKNGRCPACGGMMHRAWGANFCPHCGVQLR